ncbi:Conserved_hypothetical protein [Hexamita inflata]|uniref:Uncharacterized protein n=1 Tax=Hexamita inflata TaxID=28002 RepID=A0AA86N998_9EUKA|nr:Conserved hypothetical protein [Hexamita inflata]
MNTSILDNRIKFNFSSLKNDINQLQITLDQNLLSNTTILDWRIFNNITQLNSLITHQQNLIQNLTNIIEQQQNLVNNLTQQINCSSNQGYAVVNNSCVQVSCAVSGQQSINGICQCTNINSIVESGACVCPLNSVLVGISCVCSKAGQTMQNGVCSCSTTGAFLDNNICTCGSDKLNISNSCVCPSNSEIVNNSCQQTSYIINNTDFGFLCSQQVFTTTFNLNTVTDQISSSYNFSAGYVFSTNIQDAFIDVTNNVYTTMNPLFKNQQLFYNIQIRFGAQIMQPGSIISNINIISISQMNIISKNNTEIQINFGQLNVFKLTSNANIQNLLLNLLFSLSNGNITLINNISGTLNLSNYQILGKYQSYKCIALLSLNTISASIFINNLNIMPEIFKVGSLSSYLFSNVSQSSIQFINISILTGEMSNYQQLVSESTVSQYNFGGLVTHQVETTVNISYLISSCYQNYDTENIQSSGMLIGYAQQKMNNITIISICIQWIFSSSATYIYYIGVVGESDGDISFQKSQIILNSSSSVCVYGLIGYSSSTSTSSEVKTITITLIQSQSSGNNIGSIFGVNYGVNVIISDIQLRNSSIQSNLYTGGIVGQISYGNTIFSNITVKFSNISNQDQFAGGLVGFSSNQVSIINVVLNNVRIIASRYVGLFFGGCGKSPDLIQNLKSIGINYINAQLQNNCDNFSSITVC